MSGNLAATQRPIVLGQVTSLSGANYMGLENRDGAELAVQQLNDTGGILGRRVELRVEDDTSRAQPAIDAYGRLAEQGAVAVIGTSFSNVGLAVLPHTDERRVLYVSTGAAHTQIDPVRPYVFMTPPTGRLVAEQLVRFLGDMGVRRIGVIFDEDSVFNTHAWASQQISLGQAGITPVAVVSVRGDTKDFGPALATVAASGAQALMAWVTGPPAVGLARTFGSVRPDLPMVLGLGSAGPAFLTSVGHAVEGLVVATSLVGVGSDLPASATRAAIHALTGPFERSNATQPSQFAVDGYTAVKLIAAAVEAAGTDDRNRIRDAMETLRCVTPQGEYTFSGTDHSGLVADDVAIAVIREGRFRLTRWSQDRLRTHLR